MGIPILYLTKFFGTADGHVIVAVGNDTQFQRFCDFLAVPDIATDARFATNPARLENRDALITAITPLIAAKPMADVIAGLEARKVPVGPVQTLNQVFESDQVQAREMMVKIPTDDVAEGHVPVIGNPLKLSQTPVTYRHAPPKFGQDTAAILSKISTKP